MAPSNITPPPASLVEAAKIVLVGTASSTDDGTNLASLPACLITLHLKERRHGRQLDDRIDGQPPDVKVSFLPAPLDVPDDVASPAVNALRRLGRTPTQPRDAGFVDIGRFSRALTGTLRRVFTLEDDAPGVSLVNEHAELLAATGAHGADFECRTGHHDHLIIKNEGFSELQATPAIITLRKASAAFPPHSTIPPNTTSASSEPSHSFEPSSHPHTSTANLLAFDSKRIENESPSIVSAVSSLNENDQASPKPHTPVRQPSLLNGCLPPRKISRSMTLLGNTDVNRRHSVTAEAALTMAEFFPSPGIIIGSGNKPNLLSPEQESVRTSVVEFASRNSVHKIIWQATETSSSTSSSGPVSPSNKETLIKKPSEDTDQDPSVTLDAEIQAANDKTSLPENSVSPSTAQREAQDAFFAWSWGTSPPPVMESRVSLEGAQLRKSTLHVRKAATLDEVTVGSFPRLSDRRSTSEWRKKPLVDLHDPVTSLEEPQSHGVIDEKEVELRSGMKPEKQRSRTSPNVIQNDIEAELSSRTEKGSRTFSLNGPLFAPARVRDEGSTGRSVGVSSRMKVKSGK